MQTYKLPNAAASVLTVSTTALSLNTAISTAASETVSLPLDLNAIDLQVTAEDVTILYDGNTPTAANGLIAGQTYDTKALSLRGISLDKLQMIRTGGSDATVRIQVGRTNTV